MAIDNDRNSFNGENNSPSYRSKDNFKTNKQSTFDMFDINVSKARKDIDSVFGSAKTSFVQFERSSKKSVDNIFDKMTSNMKTFEKMQSVSISRITSDTLNKYDKMYSRLSKMQADYSNGIYQSHKNAYDKVINMWGDGFDSNINVNVNEKSDSSNSPNKNDNVNKVVDNGVDKFLSGIKDVLGTITNKILSMMGTGSDNIVNAYEDSYKTISTTIGMNQNQYQGYQRSLERQLRDMDLNDNVRVSDVMKKLDENAKMGLSQEDAKNKALSDSITNVIAPYLDTTSSAYTDLQLKLGDQFTKNVGGMSGYLYDLVGSSRVFKNSINDVITKLEPVQLWAQKQMMSGEEYAMVEALVDQGQMTQSQATELVAQASQAVSDQYGALTSGNVAQQVAVATGKTNNLADTITSMLGTSTLAQGQNALSQGAAISAFGIGGYSSQNMNFQQVLNTALAAKNEAQKSEKTPTSTFEKRAKQFAEGLFDTQKSKEKTAAENVTTVYSTIREKFPLTTELLSDISSKLDKLILTDVASGAMNFFSGKGSSASGDITKAAQNLAKASETFGEGGKIQRVFGSLDKVGNLAKGAKSGALNWISDLKDGVLNLGKLGSTGNAMVSGTGILGKLAGLGSKLPGMSGASGLASAGLSTLGIGLIAGGGIATLKHAIDGAKKSEEWLGGKTIQDKIASAVGGALGGTGSGIGEKGATFEDVSKNVLKNTSKFAALGAGIGTFIGGPIGTAIGGAVGAGVGAITGTIGGKRIAKVGKKIGDILEEGFETQIKMNPITGIMSKQFGHLVQNGKEAFSELKDIWGDKDKSFAEELGGTFGTIGKTMKDNFKDWFKSFGEYFNEVKDKLTSFGEGVKKVFSKENAEENIKKTGTSIKNVSTKASGLFSDFSKGAKESYNGSHAEGKDYIPYDGYKAILHKGEAVFNSTAANAIRDTFGITAKTTTVGSAISKAIVNSSSLGMISSIGKSINGTSSDNSDVVNAIQIATSKLIEAINRNNKSRSSESLNRKTVNGSNLVKGVSMGEAISSMLSTSELRGSLTSLKGTMPVAKSS